MTRLDELQVVGVRGIRDATLQFAGGSIVLGGGNGTGKTAFVDALQFLYMGSISSLMGTAGLSLREHGPHLLSTPQQSQVTAAFQTPSGAISRRLSGAEEISPGLEEHAREGRRLTFILRRSQLQQFIHAKPAERYRSMADLIGIDDLEKTELALKRARDTTVDSQQGAQERLQACERRLGELRSESFEEADLLFAANEQLTDLGFAEHRLESSDDVPHVRDAIVQTVARPQHDARFAATRRLAGELERGIGQETLRDRLAAYIEAVPRREERSSRAEMMDLLTILRRGREYVRATEADHCPLCRQEIEARSLLARLVKRIADLEEVSLEQSRLDRAQQELESILAEAAARLQAVQRVAREAGVHDGVSGALGDAVSMLRESMRSGSPVESIDMAGRLERTLERWVAWARATEAGLPSGRDDQEGDDQRTQAAQAALSLLQDLTMRRAEAERGRRERERLESEFLSLQQEVSWRKRAAHLADIAYTTYIQVKNEEIQRIFDELQTDLRRYYDFLHPGEGQGALALEMDPRKRGSSELKMNYYERTRVDPRAFESEGHLDSLGLCIFLAFVKRFNGDWPLLVLDDVVASVDAAHKRRVATLLFQEFGDRQILITTNDSRFFNDLRRAQAETGHQEDTKNLIIESWSLEEGPQLKEAASG